MASVRYPLRSFLLISDSELRCCRMAHKSAIHPKSSFFVQKAMSQACSSKMEVEHDSSWKLPSKVKVILGAQWGDEGKRNLVDLMAKSVDIVCRFQGGSDTSNSIAIGGIEYHLHWLPSGIINPNCIAVIGNGAVVHIPSMFRELRAIENKGFPGCRERLKISDRAHLVFDFHQKVDVLEEHERGELFLGTTRKGTGPVYSAKATRMGLRLADLLGDFARFAELFKEQLDVYKRLFPSLEIDLYKELELYEQYAVLVRPFVIDSVSFLNASLRSGKNILAVGGQATMLDIDFGTYPYVTSSNCSIGGVCSGLGVPYSTIGEVVGVVKSYTTRVGNGPFPTELNNVIGQLIQTVGGEIGETSLRKRRCGWLDIPVLKHTAMVNGYTAIFLTKLDVLDVLDTIKICVAYVRNGRRIKSYPSNADDLQTVEAEYYELEGWKTSTQHIRNFFDLPDQAQYLVTKIEELVGVPVKWIEVGRDRESMIVRY